ncbi:MAG TPA: hypothetical protein VGO75_06550 [Gemmatimonadaceae bacterium]|nr:hypothetical protein [Gemmatimonadaceae bacterium]
MRRKHYVRNWEVDTSGHSSGRNQVSDLLILDKPFDGASDFIRKARVVDSDAMTE